MVVELGDEVEGLDRTASGDEVLDEFALQVDRLADPELGCFETGGEDFLTHLRGPVGVLDERAFGATGFDHHDRDVGFDRVAEGAPGDHELERGGVTLLEGGLRDPLPVGGVGHAHRTDGSVKGDARDH